MRRVVLFVTIFFCIATGADATPAATTISMTLCNQYKGNVDFAIAYNAHNEWASAGWIRLRPHACMPSPQSVPANTVYVAWVMPSENTGSGGTHNFDVDNRIYRNFFFDHADKPQPNAEMLGFNGLPTFVGGGVFHMKFTLLADGEKYQWAMGKVTPK